MTYPSITWSAARRPSPPPTVRAAQLLWFLCIVLIVVREVLVVAGVDVLARDLAIQQMPEVPTLNPVPVSDPVVGETLNEQYLADHMPYVLYAMAELTLIWWLALRLGDGRRYARWLLALHPLLYVGAAVFYASNGHYDDLPEWNLVLVLYETANVLQLCCAVTAVMLACSASARPHFALRPRVWRPR